LRGTGVAVALPFLDAMTPSIASAANGPPPRRFIAIYGLPNGVVGKWDTAQNAYVAPWTQPGQAALVSDPFLKHFAEQGVLQKLTVLTGLTDRAGTSNHWAPVGGMLTHTRPRCDFSTNSNGVVDYCDVYEPSADQRVAAFYKPYTAIPSIVAGAGEGTQIFHGYQNNISWVSGRQPAHREMNPRAVFDRLFSGFDPQASVEAKRRMEYRKSVLDGVREDATSLSSRLGADDRDKLDQYLTGVRELELRLTAVDAPACDAGVPPAAPDTGFWANDKHEVRLKLMMDVIVKAFECDRTRVATLMYTNAYGLLSYPALGIPEYHHNFSHLVANAKYTSAQQEAWMNTYVHWALKMYAYFMGELEKRRDPDGSTLLDNSVIYFTGDVCHSVSHSNVSMPVLLGGRGGRTSSGAWAIRSGRQVRYQKWPGKYANTPREEYPGIKYYPGERSVKDLVWMMLNVVGVPNVTSFGDASAPLDLA
jgi:hypothetical protein